MTISYAEQPVQTVGLVRSDDPGVKQFIHGGFEKYLLKFYFPTVTDPAHLFEAKYNWGFHSPRRRPAGDAHPLRVFRPQQALPRAHTGSLVWLHWERRPLQSFPCYAVEVVSPGEAALSVHGCSSDSFMMEAARLGCDNGYFNAVILIDWSHGRTLVMLSSGGGCISRPWVTLVDTAKLEAHMAKAEKLDWRPL